GHVLLRGTPRRVCTRDTGLRTCRRTPCPAWRSRMEPPVAAARLRPAAPDARAPIEPAEWGDIRIAPAYPPGSASPGRRRAFGIPQARLTGPAQKPQRTPHHGLLPVPAPPGRASSPLIRSRNALRTPPPLQYRSQPSRACLLVVPTRLRVPTWSAPASSVRNGRAPEPDGATSSPPPLALRERARFRGPFPPGLPKGTRGNNGLPAFPGFPVCAPPLASTYRRTR